VPRVYDAESRSSEQGRGLNERQRVPAEIRTVSFPVSVRGYDRGSVDAYVIRVNRLIAELEATRSPQAAVRHALEQVEDERAAILGQARQAAEKITAGAQQEAEEMTARARAEAADIVVNASAEADRTRDEADEYVAKAKTEAEEILAKSRTDAAEQLRRSQEEVAALREEAQAWMHELRIDTEAIWGERRELLDDLREVAVRLEKAASPSVPD
jgi:DivIVA domain-containing protein